ncbi:MAG: carbamoyl phosphate synthase small subunit [Spirochaetes bacterium GWF1_31_7]|nr:MAG: carbamoyl phosphate synthase small subunit [Spirochaetes bacterium GWE1_32_154]OHD47286.1 MAG: carbamoyl phosphate synthase small subunit [Spirochaetes bacterium GWF1_31_7]OHD49464.1 MAG: carbamoyl phosphate synthase small subunit [Spirochaetes bacterium GWE2_31_10]OHD80575.1 MAG: carbamoyl phosphate synthase small subunit [Spirochaetes bacterium RIFOXYB1_FULL_32_8]HBD96545.1 carbamoyl phosphate synthase small subunit [Spirochaetia bacterium]
MILEENKKAYLVLEDGSIFEGLAFGGGDFVEGEVVFNTGITGYQEVLTDPSYSGQIVVMTYPQIGNYGYIEADNESSKVQVRGFVVKEHCDYPNNYRSQGKLTDYLKANNILGIQGIDTRAITKKIRNRGTMRGLITLNKLPDDKLIALAKNIEDISNIDFVLKATTEKEYTIEGSGKHIALVDFGIKTNIIKHLKSRGHKITVMRADSTAHDVLSRDFDLVLLSNGPGDPKKATYAIDLVKGLIGKIPVTGICLGHQIIALAMGLDTFKLKFGHRGGNHPVKNLLKDKVTITTQNHGYAVINENIPKEIEVTHLNLNDFTIQGIRCESKKVYCVQFHPEAGPGPEDSSYIFDDFIALAK